MMRLIVQGGLITVIPKKSTNDRFCFTIYDEHMEYLMDVALEPERCHVMEKNCIIASYLYNDLSDQELEQSIMLSLLSLPSIR